jgi:hypothetical protein
MGVLVFLWRYYHHVALLPSLTSSAVTTEPALHCVFLVAI